MSCPHRDSSDCVLLEPGTDVTRSVSTSKQPTRTGRPTMGDKKFSDSILVPSYYPEFETGDKTYPPDDARAMSPRRNRSDVERLRTFAMDSLHTQARQLQTSLQSLAQRIEEVASDQYKLEKENVFLVQYVCSLTGDQAPEGLAEKNTCRTDMYNIGNTESAEASHDIEPLTPTQPMETKDTKDT